MLKVVEKRDEREAGGELLLLDEIAREGARRMLVEALRAEIDDYVERHHGERDEHGHALAVRNGRAQARKLTLGAGTVELNPPIDVTLLEINRRTCFDDTASRASEERLWISRTPPTTSRNESRPSPTTVRKK